MGVGLGKCALALAATWVCGAALAQQGLDLGKLEYDSSCASCHGLSGKGDGPVARHMAKAPTDLTTLTRRYGGAFPTQYVWEIIDGRTTTDIGPHGSREMPVWGAEYRSRALQMQRSAPEWEYAAPPEWYVRGRIVALIDYMARIQAK